MCQIATEIKCEMDIDHRNRNMLEKHAYERPGNQDKEQCELRRMQGKGPPSAREMSRSMCQIATEIKCEMNVDHRNRNMLKKHAYEWPGNQDVERREAKMRKIAYLAPDRSRARKHRTTN
jgi:hypothetical protein